MDIGEICNREVEVAGRNMLLSDAARRMREEHVGSLVVVEAGARGRVPIGILTDRDMVVQVLAENLDYAKLTVGDIMGGDLVMASEDDAVLDTLQVMRRRGIRRLPVVDATGDLVGIVTLDDLLEIVAFELDELVNAISNETKRESLKRR
jgi:CBS domain-containing protein